MFLMDSPSSGADALPNGLDVTFEVTEIKRLTGSYNTMVGNNEGSMVRINGCKHVLLNISGNPPVQRPKGSCV